MSQSYAVGASTFHSAGLTVIRYDRGQEETTTTSDTLFVAAVGFFFNNG